MTGNLTSFYLPLSLPSGSAGHAVRFQYSEDVFHLLRQETRQYPDEYLHFCVLKRKIEFLAGRYCTKNCLKVLGFTQDIIVRPGEVCGSSPLWPQGLCGSISHSDGVACSVVADMRGLRSMGVDIERIPAESIVSELRGSVLTAQDVRLGEVYADIFHPDEWFGLVFSIKESLYKALNPLIRTFFDFHDISLKSVDVTAQRIELAFNKSICCSYPVCRHFAGCYAICDDLIWTGVFITA
ncbi:4'-phosphopantetheinyl transferase family protein [Sansalvadorimonas verongulae]|uniref:4'-phosphopantetheinyl transferase family protein n=1 Tax=Sansalvadorimonas verongulae TaxID=2172824 RepID=UPI001E499EA8|nr:4'-phosphopantetheinyl transferase superfamily protein [Sansalvadorimonas verongulae]